jgi:hypothetical protein
MTLAFICIVLGSEEYLLNVFLSISRPRTAGDAGTFLSLPGKPGLSPLFRPLKKPNSTSYYAHNIISASSIPGVYP